MYEIDSHPLDLVNALEFYLQKLHPENPIFLPNVKNYHCVRASTVTHLYQVGVDAQQICSITKHKNESNLPHYIISTYNKQKRDASRISSGTFLPSSTKAMETHLT